jgi:hypothetical protein
VGVFEADDVFDGRPIRVRFIWTRGAKPRWEQAFSEDGGRTWETNWIMDYTTPAPRMKTRPSPHTDRNRLHQTEEQACG